MAPLAQIKICSVISPNSKGEYRLGTGVIKFMTHKRMLIDAAHPEETRVAVLNGNQLEELDVESSTRRQLKGNIYLATVTRVEPSLQAAFIDYGGNRHGFLAFSDIHPDYYQIPVSDREQLIAEDEEARAAVTETDEDEEEEDLDPKDTNPSSKAIETIGGDDIDEVEDRRVNKPIRHYKIQEVIKRRQILLVQIVKEERGNKGAALTTYLSLAGRYCVLMPNTGKGGGISRKIGNNIDRKRLKSVVSTLEILEGMAVIVRTAGAERGKAEIKRDYDYLIRLWNEIRELTLESTAPALIREEANIIKRSLRDVYTRDITDVLVEGDEGYRAAKDLMKILIPSHAKKVQPYKDSTVPLFSRYHIETQLESMIGREVKLKSGGYIVIDSTEALVAIDVNSGRATRGRNIEETALKTNLEAANEVARQIRLRDLAGLIVIDFIDMDFHRNQTSVERRLKEGMHRDRAKIQIGRISPFGLLELSRQRMRPSITETTTDTCPNCGGSGIRRSTESTALHVLRGIEEDGVRYKDSEIEVNVPTEVALYMLNYKREALAEIEKKHDFKIIISENNTLIPPQFTLVQHGAPAPHQTDKVKQNGTKLEEDREPAGNETKKRKRRRPRRRNKGIDATDSSLSNTKPAEDISANSFEKDSVGANEPNNETPKKRRRVRHKKSAINQTKNVNSSELESTPPAVAAENDAALSKANDNVKTNSTETDYLNPEKHSPVTKRPDGNSNVTIVGTDDQVKNTDDTRRGWWQKLAD